MILEAHALRFSYNPNTNFQFADFKCEVGQHLLITGASGSGKTTLLHLIAGLQKPDSGKIMACEIEMSALSDAALDRFRGKHIGIVFQKPHFVSALSVLENLELASWLSGKGKSTVFAKELLAKLDIGNQTHKRISQLSTGQLQRLSIVRAVMNRPKLLLADEPTSSLDDANCDRVKKLLFDIADQIGATLVVVTHDQRLKSDFTHHYSLQA